ncbi:hypothetical protein ABKN59_010915 [Abortiporus biennis]
MVPTSIRAHYHFPTENVQNLPIFFRLVLVGQKAITLLRSIRLYIESSCPLYLALHSQGNLVALIKTTTTSRSRVQLKTLFDPAEIRKYVVCGSVTPQRSRGVHHSGKNNLVESEHVHEMSNTTQLYY